MSQSRTEAFTVRTEAEKVAAIDALANQQDRSRNYIMNQAIDYLLDVNQWQTGKIKVGQEAVKAKDFATDEAVEQVFAKYAPKA